MATLAGVPHAYDFMEYAHLQLGQDAKAKALIEQTAAIKKVIGPTLGGHDTARPPCRLATRSSARTGWCRATAAA